MTTDNPLQPLQQQAEAQFIAYGPVAEDGSALQIVESFGEYEAEYAAIRKGVGILDQPQRGLVEVRGADRADFLHRIITNDTRTLQPGQGRRAFLLNKAGRIVADMVLLQQEQRLLVDLDVFQAAQLPGLLDAYLFSEDVAIRDASVEHWHVALHGPAAVALLSAAGAEDVAGLEPLAHRQVQVAGAACTVYRRDDAGSLGLHLLMKREDAAKVYGHLTELVGGLAPETVAGEAGAAVGAKRAIVGRGIGWLAYNTARIEAGTPIFHIDFGPDSLPHETGVEPLKETVSFTKGCYLGQEIVARMQSLGHPKKVLVGVRFQDERLPIAGSQVLEPIAGEAQRSSGQIIGAVTSSTLSPLLGRTAIALAMMKWGKHRPGVNAIAPAEGGMTAGTVQGLSFMR